MAVSFRTSTQNSGSTGTAISVSAPTGTTAGDLVKVIVHANGDTTIVDNTTLTVSASNLSIGNDTDGNSSSTTSSITPSSNKLVLVSVVSHTAITADPNQPTITGCGLTWEVVNSIVYDTTSSSRRRITVLRSMGASPSSGALTIDFGGQNQSNVAWVIDEFTNVDTSGTNGSGAVVQSATNKDETVTTSSLTVTLGAFSNTANATYGAFSNYNNIAITSYGSGFTKLNETGAGTSICVATEFKSTNDTGVDITFSENSQMGGVAVELKAATIFTEQINDYHPNPTSGHTISIFSRVIQAGDPTTYNFTSGASGRWGIIAICATDSVTPVDDYAPNTGTGATNRDDASDGTAVTESITTGVDNAINIICAGWDTSAIGTITTPTGYTLLANANGGGEPLHASYKVITTAGATGTQDIVNTEFGAYITFSFSIKAGTSATVIKDMMGIGFIPFAR